MIRLSLLGVYLFFLIPAQMPSTTDWRGLSPLKSNRMDVERTLGPPDQKIEDQQMTYYFSDVVVFFDFSSNPKCQQKLPYTSWDVTPDTVTGIYVSLRHPKKVEETGIDLTTYKKIKGDYDVVNHYYYVNPDDNGFAIEVGNNHVGGYHYAPGSQHKNLRCEPTNRRQHPQKPGPSEKHYRR
jgi:hypothetical protein